MIGNIHEHASFPVHLHSHKYCANLAPLQWIMIRFWNPITILKEGTINMAYQYIPIGHEEDHNSSGERSHSSMIKFVNNPTILLRGLCLSFSWVLCIWIGYNIRKHFTTEEKLILVTFHYNRTFSSSPSSVSNQARNEIFPGEL